MRVVPLIIVAACWGAFLVGCNSANRRQGGGASGGTPFMGATAQGSGRPAAPVDPLEQTSRPPPDLDGILAGQVVDRVTGRPVSAKIRWTCLEESKEEGDRIYVDTDNKGFFIIQGLKSGRHYKLVASAKQPDRALTGVLYTVAPSPRCVIPLQEDRSAPAPAPEGGTPAPPPPAPPNRSPDKTEDADKKKAALTAPERPASAVVPVWEPGVGSVSVPPPSSGRSPVTIRTPVPLAPEAPPTAGSPARSRPPALPPTERFADPSRIAQEQPRRPWEHPANIQGPAPIPSCLLIGQQLRNFALYDLSGRPWEYRIQHRGKVVLIDFWASFCQPCKQAVPHLRALQERYGPAGLQVIGIACEGAGDPREQAQRAALAAQSLQINYTLLLSAGGNCPVKTQFTVGVLPTLVLVGEHGYILWRHEGRLDPEKLQELERHIRLRLGTN